MKKENGSVMEFIRKRVSDTTTAGVAVVDVTAPKFQMVATVFPLSPFKRKFERDFLL